MSSEQPVVAVGRDFGQWGVLTYGPCTTGRKNECAWAERGQMQELGQEIREKALRLIDYLKQLAQMRATAVMDWRNYQPYVLWLDDIPHEDGCWSRTWGPEQGHEDEWLKIIKKPDPKLPPVPEVCRIWVVEESLRDDEGQPRLREEILAPPPAPEPAPGPSSQSERPPQVLQLSDHPEVKASFQRYLDRDWATWADNHRRWRSVQEVYAKLWEIHQARRKAGEEYELVLGVGLLQWAPTTGQKIERHLVVGQADLMFDRKRGAFTVQPATSGTKLAVELEMVDTSAARLQQVAEAAIEEAGDDPWGRAAIDAALNVIVHSLADQGEYAPDSMKGWPMAGPAPRVTFSPALILRKKSTRGYLEALRTIRERIEKAGEIPPHFLKLIEVPIAESNQPPGDGTGPVEVESPYFPLAANEEQRQIVARLRRSRGVLVQGPPGTGKSHTIANLICHLLANGQRLLITAQTPRALHVLHKMLPDSIKPLCVSMLGEGLADQKALKESVGGIRRRKQEWNEHRAATENARKEQEIREVRDRFAVLNGRLRQVREAETYKHDLPGGCYRGTAGRIAQRLERERDALGWIPDRISPDQDSPLTPEEVRELTDDLRNANPERDAELDLALPDPTIDLPDQDEFRDWVREETGLGEVLAKAEELLKHNVAERLRAFGRPQLTEVSALLGKYLSTFEHNRTLSAPWVEDAIAAVLARQDKTWVERHDCCVSLLNGLADKARRVDALQVRLHNRANPVKIAHDGQSLRMHFRSGGGLGFWAWFRLFVPKPVRTYGYVLTEAHIDGETGRSAPDPGEWLGKLLDWLEVQERLGKGWEVWAQKATRAQGTFAIQVAELQQHVADLGEILLLKEHRQMAFDACRELAGFPVPPWEDPQGMRWYVSTIQAVLAEKRLGEVEASTDAYLDKLKARLSSDREHPITKAVLDAIVKGDPDLLARLRERLVVLSHEARRLHRRRELLDKLHLRAPLLAEAIAGNPYGQDFKVRLPRFGEAWAWSRAAAWVEAFNNEDVRAIERQVQKLTEQIGMSTAEIAALRAWDFCLRRMTDEHQANLAAWELAFNKIPKSGPHLQERRRAAQAFLDNCRSAIPAWVMPLHRVYDTVTLSPEAFDVVIVDEASQCGPDALPLLYLGKTVLIVGDSEQISPEAVGINMGVIFGLLKKFLYDFKFAATFDPLTSLFGQGQIRFGHPVVLREHFRCVREIIRFSNDLCYAQTPLIPLRPHQADRLKPVCHEYVAAGHREGSDSNVINRPEADALVRRVVECCRDPRYDGKTMGVIALQGHAQSRLIELQLLKHLEVKEIEDRRLICGESYSFQGDERDVIFLSMVAAPNETIGAFVKPADRQRFNVAASRAKDQMWLFHSVTVNDLSPADLRRALLEFFEDPVSQINRALGQDAEELRQRAHQANRDVEDPPKPFDSWFEVDVALEIGARGFRVIPQFPVAHKRIDLLVEGSAGSLAVECDGDIWHGLDRHEEDDARQRQLERCRWRFWRVRFSEFYANRAKAMEPLWATLDSLGIKPVGARPVSTAELPPVSGPVEGPSLAQPGPVKSSRSSGPSISSVPSVSSDEGSAKAERSEKGEPEVAPESTQSSSPPQKSDSQSGFHGPLYNDQRTVGTQRNLYSPPSEPGSSNKTEEHGNSDHLDVVQEMEAVGFAVWSALLAWSRDSKFFDENEEKLVHTILRRKNRQIPPSRDLAEDCKELLARAKARGFSPPADKK